VEKSSEDEYKSLIENQTWKLVKLQEERKCIDCKWVFRVKYNQHGKVDKFKVRLVAKGFSQKYGLIMKRLTLQL